MLLSPIIILLAGRVWLSACLSRASAIYPIYLYTRRHRGRRACAMRAVWPRCRALLSHDRLSIVPPSREIPRAAVAPIWIRSVRISGIVEACSHSKRRTVITMSMTAVSLHARLGRGISYPPPYGFISYVHLSDLPRSSNTRTSAAAAAAAGRPAAQRAGGQADWRAPTRRRRQTSLQR